MNNEKEASLSSLQGLLRTGAVITHSQGVTLQIISIIGQIEGHSLLSDSQKTTKYEHLMPLLVSVEENESIDGLLVLLNTAGGDVEAGLALSELISGMKRPTVSLVLGGGHSIGVPLAVSAKKSFIVPSASMTLHPVRANGLVLGAPQSFWYFAVRAISITAIKPTKSSKIQQNTCHIYINIFITSFKSRTIPFDMVNKIHECFP